MKENKIFFFKLTNTFDKIFIVKTIIIIFVVNIQVTVACVSFIFIFLT